MSEQVKHVMLGNEAFARGAYEAGVKVISSYPGTPSTEITENATKYESMHVEWAPNEKVAMEVACGAGIAGARALTCMKHVGLNVAADPFFTAAYTGVNGGIVAIVADDNGCHSSQNEQDSRFYARSAGVIMLEPSNSQECKDYIKIAYDISEQYDSLVLVRSHTRISHSRGVVSIGEPKEVVVKPYKKNIQKYVAMPAMARRLHVEQEARLNKFCEDSNKLEINKIEKGSDEIGIITSGICYQYVKEAMPEASILKIGSVYPLPKELIKEFASSVKKVYVMEEGEPFIQNQVRLLGIEATGKEYLGIQGEYSTNRIKEVFGKEIPEKLDIENAPVRPPLMCAGCPHRAVFHTLKKLKKIVSGDIGCYTLGSLPPTSAMDVCLCMGASISMAHGFAKAGGREMEKDVVAVIGDSTFFHSGITGLINMVYNGCKGTVMILDNRITGMTGHQHNPCTGFNAKGEPAPEIDIKAVCQSIGIKNIVEIDPFELNDLEKLIKEESEREELSVIITKRPCVLIIKPTDLKYCITEDCKKCKKCMEIGCPAIEKQRDDIVIVKERCVGCDLCTRTCPFGAIKEDI